jgi:hypothetical protein
MSDTLDKVIDTAKKLRKFAKKVADPAFANLIADLTMSLADLKVQLADRGASAPAAEPKATEPKAASSRSEPAPAGTAAQVSSKFDTLFGSEPDKQG